MVRLSTTSSALHDKPHALVQALQAGLEAGLDDPGQEDRQTLAMVQGMLGALPKQMQTDAAEVMQQVLTQGLPASAMQLLGEEGETTAQRISHMREQLQKQEQAAQTPIKIEYYHCDHLGTPMALTDQQGRIAWAAKLDPWGNVQEEYNPDGIEQPIRLPGQHHDRETGLYYNRHRYYDPAIGSYINQDPIGLAGGSNKSIYSNSPLTLIDPLGLWASQGVWLVHQNVTLDVLGSEAGLAGVAAMNRGHIWADSPEHQTVDFTHMHAMRRPGQSKADACKATNAYIKEQAQKALDAKSTGKMNDAYFHFGAALHAIQDATSPSHTGFQVWSGHETRSEQLAHAIQEASIPDKDSPLFESTKRAWEAFKKGDINGFSCPCD